MTTVSHDPLVIEASSKMPKPTFFNLPEEKRQRIIDASIAEFAGVPYARATLDKIVKVAGISKGSMYQFFANKAYLYFWILTV